MLVDEEDGSFDGSFLKAFRDLSFFKLLNRPGEWESVPENSQLLSDIKYRLMYIYQYHQDFYHPDEGYLKVRSR